MRTVILTCLMCSAFSLSWSQELSTQLSDGNIAVLEKLIYLDQVEWASKDDLRSIRNTIYAKYGLIFKDKELSAYFSKFSWYRAIKANVDRQLTTIDKANIRLVKRIEDNLPTEESLKSGILGIWYDYPIAPSDLPDQLQFFPDGVFKYTSMNGTELYGCLSFSGTWSLQNSKLILSCLTEKVFLYDSVVLDVLTSSYSGGKSGEKYILPERTEINDAFKIEDIDVSELAHEKLTRQAFDLFGRKWYRW